MKIKNREISAVFKATKSYLSKGIGGEYSDGSLNYICNAISEVFVEQARMLQTYWVCRDIIMSRFPVRHDKAFPHSVDTYLRECVGVPFDQLTHKAVQRFRHRWLDSLVKEFDVDGYYEC